MTQNASSLLKTAPIGVFDSGIGGVSVLKHLRQLLPHEDLLYCADSKHAPYGNKSPEFIRERSHALTRFLIGQGAKAIVVACNTATAGAIASLREHFSLPIIGMEPAVKPAVEKVDSRRVLVFATPITVREKKLHDLVERLDSEQTVDLHALPVMVEFAEKFIFDEDIIIQYLLDEFAKYDLREYSAVVLGCTHFIFYRKHFMKILPQGVEIIDGNIGTVNRLMTLLENRKLGCSSKGSLEFYCSGDKDTDDSKYRRYLELEY